MCRELTKTHEEVRRGPLAELVAWAADGVRGEVTLVVAGAPPGPAYGTDADELRGRWWPTPRRPGMPRKRRDRSRSPGAPGVPKRVVYDAVHRLPTRAVLA